MQYLLTPEEYEALKSGRDQLRADIEKEVRARADGAHAQLGKALLNAIHDAPYFDPARAVSNAFDKFYTTVFPK